MTVDRRLAGLLVQEALGAVVDPAIVATLREDSPLAAAGLSVTDAVCVADGVATAAADRGLACALTDDDLAGATTVADVVDAVVRRTEVPGA